MTAPLKSSLITYQFIHGDSSLGPLESFQFSPVTGPWLANCLNILPLITPCTRDTRNDRAIWRTIFHGVRASKTKSSERIGGALVTGHFATSRDLYAYVAFIFQALIHFERCCRSVDRLSLAGGKSRTPRTFLFSSFFLPLLSFSLSFSACERFKIRPGSRRSRSRAARRRGAS